MAWGELGPVLERLRLAAERIRQQEGFVPAEWLPLQDCWLGLDLQQGAGELSARLGRLGADPKAPYRTRVLAAALGMLLWDLAAVSPEEREDLEQAGRLEARLQQYYHRGLEAEGACRGEHDQAAWQPAARQRRLQETLAQWEEEILPPAVSMVCADAGVAIPSRFWPDLAEGHLSRVRRELGLSGRREAFLRRLERILPAVREDFLAHLEELLQLVEADRWDRLRPRPEDLALVLRGKLWQRPPRPAQEPEPGPEPGPPGSSRNHGSVEEQFRRAFQELIRHHLEQEVEQALRRLQEDLQGEAGRVLVEALVRSTRGEDATTGLRRAVQALRRAEESRREAEEAGRKEDPLAELARYFREAIEREVEAQGMSWEDLLARVKEQQASPGPRDPDLKVLLNFLQKEERGESEGGGG